MAWTSSPDPFEALGVSRDAPEAAIRRRYRELARRYHPNRHQFTDGSNNAPSDYFHTVYDAWQQLSRPESRRRHVERLQLLEEQEAVLAGMADLLDQVYHKEEQAIAQSPTHDGHVSSDADEDAPPPVGIIRRKTLDRAMSGKNLDNMSSSPVKDRRKARSPKRVAAHDSAAHLPALSTQEAEKKSDYFTQRRKELEKLRRQETQAFFQYQNAMLVKFEAELEAERTRERYESAKWDREYLERAPREITERMRSFRQYVRAARAFGQTSQRRRRPTLTYAGQILSTDDVHEKSRYLLPDHIASPSARRPPNRRGWSSDVSGDQTSSDDNSSEPVSRPGSAGLWHRRHSRHTSLETYQHANSWPNVAAPSQANTAAANPSPFQLLVKRPTGFHDPQEVQAHDSSVDSASASSRSPSPRRQDQSLQNFTVLPRLSLADILGGEQFRTALTAFKTEVKRRNSPNGAVQEIRRDIDGKPDFMIKQVRAPKFRHIPLENVHLLDLAEASWMLGVNPDEEASPSELMSRLARLDPNVARKFEVKPDIKAQFNFRLIHGQRQVSLSHDDSYIALSYRRKRHVVRENDHFTLPLDPEMFQAVWDERISETEGLWVDQISIDADSEREKTISMSAMDIVYRSARLAVVVLDDITLNAHEAEVLGNHMKEYSGSGLSHVAPTKRFGRKQPAYLESHEDLYSVVQILLSSSWFRRAWCRHEMRLARQHVFLVPCKAPGTWTGRSVVRFTSQCLSHLLALATEVPFDDKIEMVKPALNAFFRDRSKLAEHCTSLRLHHGNFTTVVAEVLNMEAGGDPRIPARQRAADAMKDKISIILNTMECGLALTEEMRDPGMSLSRSEYHYMLLMLALAAQDPGALCSVGPPMRLLAAEALSPSASSTWLFEPTNVDSGLNNYRTLNRLPADALVTTHLQFGEHYVKLDLEFLQAEKVSRPVDTTDTLTLARHFTSVCERRQLGRNRGRYLILDALARRHFGDMKEVYAQTLACVFECGADWMEDVCHRYGVSRWKQDLQGAYELLVALKSTNGKWPESAWTSQSAGFVMDFVNFLVIRGLPQRQILHHEEWRPVWVRVGNGGKVLTFVPLGDVRMAVPTALLDLDYVHLARLWVLEPRPTFTQSAGQHPADGDWTLLGKSVLFSDDLAIEQLHSKTGTWRAQEKVFGRDEPDIQRALRERNLFV